MATYSDISNANWNSTDSGQLSVANGGTGQTSYTNGELLIGNTTNNTLTKTTLTDGANITITNGAGSITIAASADTKQGALTPKVATGTISAAELLKGFITGDDTFILTTATAALIVAAITNCVVGSSFRFIVTNIGAGTVTLKAGTNVNLKVKNTHATPSPTADEIGIATQTTSEFYVVVTAIGTGSEAVDIIQIW